MALYSVVNTELVARIYQTAILPTLNRRFLKCGAGDG
jgi:hypothetical protein